MEELYFIKQNDLQFLEKQARKKSDSVYDIPDELGFVAIKPGPKQRVGSSWRDATYIRIYGCASFYLK
jgi:hypothetical protein